MIGMGTTIFLVNPVNFSVPTTDYLADDYAFDAVYSLYKESATATNCLRVRRTSDNAEQDIGFDGDYIDQTSIESFCGVSDGYVVTWYDQKNSNDVTQSTALFQPRIVDSGSMRSDVSFLTTERYLDLGSAVTALGSGEFSFFTAFQSVQSNDFRGIFTTSSTGASLEVFADTTTAKTRSFRVYNGVTDYSTSSATAHAINTDYLLSGFIDASKNMSVFSNGVAGTTNTYTGSYTNNNLRLGTNPTKSRDLSGSLYGFYVSGSDLSADRVAIETVINNRLSIY